MGSLTHQQQPQPPIFSLDQFTPIQPNSYTRRQTYGSFTCLQHKITQQQIDRYFIQFSSKKQQQLYYQCYQQRYRQQYIVSTIQYIDKTHKQFCSNLYTCQVYIEHIPVRLDDITDIPYPDNLYILKNSLLGFQLLFGMIGYFQVRQQHVCINNYGEVKVWLNSDLSKNYPQDCNQLSKSECDMVSRVIFVIQHNTSNQQCPIQISQYFRRKGNRYPKFQQAINLLQQYISQYKPIIPKYCQSIFQLFKQSQKDKSLPLSQLQNQVQVQENRGSIQLSDPVVPMLRIPAHGSNDQNVDYQVKSSAANTEKIEGNVQNYYQGMEENARVIMQNQVTQRKNYQIIPHKIQTHHSSPQKIIIQNYNKLQTKRTPVSQKTLTIAQQFPRPSTKQKPVVHFTYNSPTPATVNIISNSFVRPRNNSFPNVNVTFNNVVVNIVNNSNIKTNFNENVVNNTNTGGLNQVNEGLNLFGFITDQRHKFDNINNRQNQKQQKIQKQKQNRNEINIDKEPNSIIHVPQLQLQRQQTDKNNTEHEIYQFIQTDRQQQQNKKIQIQQANKKINKNIDDKSNLCYYDTGSGSEQIDPEIAADLIKYL